MDSVSIKFDFNYYEEDSFMADNFYIYLGDTIIGSADGFFDDVYFRIDGIDIEEEYRGKGYGTKAMEQLIDFAKSHGVLFIRAECPSCRINFYKRLGAIFECRTEDDETYINNVFYIDIGDKKEIMKLIKEIDDDLKEFELIEEKTLNKIKRC